MFVLMAFAAPGAADHPQETAAGTVTFDHRGGNEWWVEAVVTHDGSNPDEVHARDEGDATWHALEFKDWGEWGGSFHIEPGHRVMFRSTDHTLGAAESCWFTHPQGVEDCEAPPPPPPGDFDATFDTPGGNDWWVEVYVDANKPLAGVDARADGGSWHQLTLRSWGAWAKSFHVPDGSTVEFRAHSTGGNTDMSGQYRWPSGEPVGDPEPPATFDAAFGPKASNEWWVETLVIADGDIDSVEARANGGAWHELTLRSWGSWAGSFHAPEGSSVEFRAFDAGGAVSISDGFLWPDAVPVADPNGEWPQEGSYARYQIFDDLPGPSESSATATLIHHDGRWLAQCEGTTTDQGGETTEINEFRATDPPFAPTDVTPGQGIRAGALYPTCSASSVGTDVDGPDTYDTHQEGDPVTVVTWQGMRVWECNCASDGAEWDQDTGLVMSWAALSRSARTGDLEDTDSPLGTV